MSAGRLPDFLYIGVAKAGSSWIAEILAEHPEVYIPPAKDICFFDREYDRGVDWYRGFFRDAGGARAAGEIAHDYYLEEETARRIEAALPDVRLLACLREPLDRLLSGYRFNRGTEFGAEVSLEAYAARDEIRRQLAYADRLTPFVERFGRERLLVLYYDELKTDPVAFAERMFRFLGVDPAVRPPSLTRVVNPARATRWEAGAHFVYRVAQGARALGLANLVGRVKRSRLTERILYRARPLEVEVPPALSRAFARRTREEAARLERLLGAPAPAAWRRAGE